MADFMRLLLFFFNDPATTEIYTVPYTLSLHDALPISRPPRRSPPGCPTCRAPCAASRSEEHTSELQSHGTISYAVFCLKKKKGRYRSRRRGSSSHCPGTARPPTRGLRTSPAPARRPTDRGGS